MTKDCFKKFGLVHDLIPIPFLMEPVRFAPSVVSM
jgi:hypothetical protein